MSAMPIGMPGWPELAFWTASIASARIALAMSARVDVGIARRVEPSFIVARLEEGENPEKLRLPWQFWCLRLAQPRKSGSCRGKRVILTNARRLTGATAAAPPTP
jgi:hypothetical protein